MPFADSAREHLILRSPLLIYRNLNLFGPFAFRTTREF